MGNVKVIIDLSLRFKGCDPRRALWLEWFAYMFGFEYTSTHLQGSELRNNVVYVYLERQ